MATTISGSSGVTYPSGGVDNTTSAGVGINDTQTLTNKTLTTPNINSAQIATVAGTAPLYMCRAWCVFNGATTGTNAPTNGGNVTSVTRTATGTYTVNFTTAMPTANYATVITAGTAGNTESQVATSPTTTSVVVNTQRSGTGPIDDPIVSVAIFC